MKVATHEDIVNLGVDPRKSYEWASYAIEHKAEMMLPSKISLKPKTGAFCNVMPSIVAMPDGRKFGGVKMVTRYLEREPSLDSKLILFDADNGDIKAIMDANWITAMRTGAVAAHSLKLFAKSNFKTLGMIGLGNTARAALLVYSAISDKKILVKLLKYKDQEKLFCERFKDCTNIKFEFCDTVEQLISESDAVVSSATYLPNDLCIDQYFRKGILLVPIHTLGFTNCDLFFDKVFADDIGHVSGFKNFAKFKKLAEVSEVVNGTAKGRENDNERIIAYNIGVAMHDIFFAANLYAMLDERKLSSVDFLSPTSKFWI